MSEGIFRQIGTIYVLKRGKDDYPLISIGPHWMFFLGCWWFILIIGVILLALVAPIANVSWLIPLGAPIIFIGLLTYLCAALRNPGIEQRQVNGDAMGPLMLESKLCTVCGVEKLPGTTHWIECDVCIRKYDHHCPLTSKWIGEGNIACFKLFFAMTCIMMIYAIVCIAVVFSTIMF